MNAREQIIEALEAPGLLPASIDRVADALMPLVDRLRAEAAAEALEEMADGWMRPGRPHRSVPTLLRDRAAALRNEATS